MLCGIPPENASAPSGRRTASGTGIRAPRKLRALAALIAVLSGGLAPHCATAKGGVETAGDILEYVLPALAIGKTGWERDKTGFVQLGESYALSLGVTYTLKYTVNETRPNGGSHSMPSGHTSSSFTAAEYMRKRYGWAWGIPLYAAASFVAYSRVESNQHYPKDVLAGAGIGILSSYIFTRPYHGFKVRASATTRMAFIKFSKDL